MLFPLVVEPGLCDLRLKIVPLSQAVAALSNLGDLRLETDPKVAERKITVLLRRAEPREVMARIADVMRLRWEADGRTLRLTTDPALEARERAHVEAERAEQRHEAEESLREWAVTTPSDPTRVSREIKAAFRDLSTKRFGDPGFAQAALSVVEERRRASWAGLGLRSLDAEGWNRLLAGDALLFDTDEHPAGYRLSGEALIHTPFSGGDPSAFPRVVGMLEFHATSGMLQVGTRTYRSGNHASSPKSGGSSGESFSVAPWPLLNPPQSPFASEIEGWNQKKLEGPWATKQTDAGTSEQALDWATGAFNFNSPSVTYPLSDSDRLEWLHDATGVDVVARADRHASLVGVQRFDGTIAEFVRAWQKENPPGLTDAFRLIGRTLMFRPAEYWMREGEPSESVLRSLEGRRPTLDDWADLAAKITWEQASDLANRRVLFRRAADPLWQHGLLCFWSVLSPSQKAKAKSGILVADDLTPSQRKAYIEMATAKELMGFFSPEVYEGIVAGSPKDVGFGLSGNGAQGWWARIGTGQSAVALIPQSK